MKSIKKVVTMVFATLFSACALVFTACGADITASERNCPLDKVFEFSVASMYTSGGPLKVRYIATYGQDSHGNIYSYYNDSSYYISGVSPDALQRVYVKGDGVFQQYDFSYEEMNFVAVGNKTLSSARDAMPPRLLGSNDNASLRDATLLAKNGWKYEKIEAVSYENEDEDKDLNEVLAAANCTLYKLTKEGSNEWYECAIQKDYKWTIYLGHMQENGKFVPKLLPTNWVFDHDKNYADLLK